MLHSGFATRCLFFSLAITTMHATLDAQTSRGAVTGMVTDAQKAVVRNARILLTGLATNLTRSATTNESGLYRFEAVDPGAYKLTVQSMGFRTAVAAQILVSAGEVATQDATLEVGDLLQVVEVNSSAVALRTESAVRGGVVDHRSIVELPIASRNPVELGLTLPGVSSSKFATPTYTFVVNGARGRSNNFMIDGTDNNDISVQGQAFLIRNPGSVQEVSVQTNNYDAEFGRAGGGVVNVITRSGTNTLARGGGLCARLDAR